MNLGRDRRGGGGAGGRRRGGTGSAELGKRALRQERRLPDGTGVGWGAHLLFVSTVVRILEINFDKGSNV